MGLDRNRVVSAQVILRPASGGSSLDHGERITSETIAEYLPAPARAAMAAETLRGAGFDVGPLVGNSFSITGPVALFERFFKTQLRPHTHGTVKAGEHGEGSFELPVHALPDELRGAVDAVTFTPPPDFGPTSFGP